ncbi:bifunctional 3-(3-hydroxy-phenyl)propionate/3-hydroxycinnamic acid hydroxylase [Rhodococcus sp. NPDC127530]|uniref:bifunctional 3-(3-hydroxy-phenyl)propionate/3-hydroxycinnamic acid hydroxylase n=1 Tax=unclassified Rhodococcus (in: high G+C Gram-positive bacteria) TaxID=192944 RepID=UPI00362F4A04
MTTTDQPRPAAVETLDADVLIVGAGPVGLTTANFLGMYGISTLVIDSRDTLIDYPRGVGLDDESLRGFQTLDLVDAVLPHTVPNQIMRFVNGNNQLLAEIAPSETPFGWPRRNGFVQPLVDAELLSGLDRFAHTSVLWSRTLVSYAETPDRVTATIEKADGERSTISTRYIVGSDGGRSTTRRVMGTSFDGTTASTRWLVVDIHNDPLGTPNIYVGADPQRPYVSVSIAHGIRRFEFMIKPEETDTQAEDPTFVASLLAPFVDDPASLDIIRRRVYTHHSRIAGEFRRGRVLLAGDAAHLMPVWQGQGYNSGIRDAVNLGWKLAAVVNGSATDALLDTYDAERREHATAMIQLSTLVGKVISPTNRSLAAVRDVLLINLSRLPSLKRYIVEMRFKPMPRYKRGAVLHNPGSDPANSPVGRLFIQPRVDTRSKQNVMLDEVLGSWFAIVCWNNSPAAVLDEKSFREWKSLGAKFFSLRPLTQMHWPDDDHPDVEVVGDRNGDLKAWFDTHQESVLFIRPDRVVAGACTAQSASPIARTLTHTLSMTPGDDHATRALLHVAQPSARPLHSRP